MTPPLETFCENDALAKEMKILNFRHNKFNQRAADALGRLLLKVAKFFNFETWAEIVR